VLSWRLVRAVLSPQREEALKSAYHRHGVKIVFTARHVMGLRAAAFLTAGIVRIPFGRFLAVDAGAAMIGVPLSFGMAFFFTDQLEQIRQDVHRVERWVIMLALVALAGWIAVRSYRRSRAFERQTQVRRGDAR
jgi:membrane protein DedA with SNARE-associated domain